MKKLLFSIFLLSVLCGCARDNDGFEHFSLDGVDYNEYVYYPVSGDAETYVLADISDEDTVKTGLFYKMGEGDFVLLMKLDSSSFNAHNDDSVYRFYKDKLYGVTGGDKPKVFEVELIRRHSKMRELKFEIKGARGRQYTPIAIDNLDDANIDLSLNVFSEGRGTIEKYSCSLNSYECALKNSISSDEFKSQINLDVEKYSFVVRLDDNPTSRELFANLPMDVSMKDLNGNEKYHYFGRTFTSSPRRVERIEAGDIMLYGDNCLVIFYETFETQHSYTRLGHIEELSFLKEALGNGDVKVKFTE